MNLKLRSFYSILMMILLTTCISTGKIIASDHNKSDSNEEQIFGKIVDDKCYFKPGSVVVSATGIFLIIQGQLVSIPAIESDAQGIFTKIKVGLSTCPVCGSLLYPWGTCTNTACPTNN